MIPTNALASLATIGLTTEQASAVADMLRAVEDATRAEANSAIDARRASDRARKERQRHGKSRDITGQHVTERDTPLPNREVSPTPPLEINPTPTTLLRSVSVSAREAFDRFWSVWPNKVGRPSAERSFAKVAAEVDAIVCGVAAYVRDKPADRPWLNPATFLNQRRWEDRPAAPPCGARAGPNGSKQSRLDRDADYIRKMMGTDDEPRPNQAPDFFDGPTIDAVATRVS